MTRSAERPVMGVLISLLCSLIFTGLGFSGQEDIKPSPKGLLLYELDNDRQLHVAGVVPIDPAMTIHQKMMALLKEITRSHYSDGRSLEVLKTKTTRAGFIVTVDLRESETDFFRSKWYQSFQGELGAHQTFVRIFFDLLQPDYPGFWFSGINLVWNGKPFDEEMKDALDFDRLTGTTYRQGLRSSR